MLRMTWRNIFARKVRLALSAFAIVLGVAFVAGSFVFTDAMGNAFDGIIEGSTSDVEVGATGSNTFTAQEDNRVLPRSVVDRLRRLPEAKAVHASVQLQTVYVIGRDGKVVGGNGPPGLAGNDTGARSVNGKRILTLDQGRLPRRDGEVALDVDAARKAGYAVGDRVTLATTGRPATMKERLVGLVEFGSGGLNGATLTVLDLRALQQHFFGGRDVYTKVSLETAPGVSQQQLRDAAQQVLPRGWRPAPAPRSSRPTRPSSTGSSASSTRSCWSSPGSPWWSAPTSSSTPSRSWSPSAAGSSRCCGRWAPRAAR